MKKYLLVALIIGSVVGCTNSAKEVAADIEASQKANSDLPGQLEWDSSEYHPKQLFAKWRKDKSLSAEVCKGLKDKETKTLSLFEEELKNPENQEILKDCKAELESKLEKYWKSEREKAQNN